MAKMPPITLPAPAYFLSDAHLGAAFVPDPHLQIVRLNQLLDGVEQTGKSLVLGGDLFDFWFEWRTVIPKRYFHELHRLRTLVDKGVQVHYLAGNHDFRLAGFLEQEVGLRTDLNALICELGGKKTFVFHGDGVLARDRGYRAMKKIFRARWAQKLFSLLHPDLAMSIAGGTSKTSRVVIKGYPEDDFEYQAYAEQRFAEGFQQVILGHTHRPVEFRNGENTYINLGDWITHFSYGFHDGAQLKLCRMEVKP
jgi:UDP-2,3-diacylglucosamine hydrolase